MARNGGTIHASVVLLGAWAVLIRGPSGSGKSRLVFDLIQAGTCGLLPFTRLVGDDRVHCVNLHDRLIARPAAGLEGLIEVRGLGLMRLPYEPVARVALIADLGTAAVPRMPEPHEAEVEIDSVRLPRLAVAAGDDPMRSILALARCEPASEMARPAPALGFGRRERPGQA